MGKRLDEKAKVDFKTYDITNWETITIHILSNMYRQPDNGIWAVNRILNEILFMDTKCGK